MRWIILILVAAAVSAQLQIEKFTDPAQAVEGQKFQVVVNVTNPYGKEIPIRIQSRDVVGSSGYDIQCFDLMLPKEPWTAMQLGEIVPYESGDFTLEKTTILYNDPDSGQTQTLQSKEVKVNVKEDASVDVKTQSISTVYECNGQSMRSTQTTSSSQQNNQETDQQDQQSSDQMQKKMDKMQNNQLSQDAKAIKNQMQEQLEEQKQMEEELRKAVEDSQEFQDMKKQLEEQGYQQKSSSMNPSANQTGEFSYEFEKEGDKAEVSGSMQDGEIQEMEMQSTETQEKLQEMLEQDPRFQEYEKELLESGYNRTEFSYEQNPEDISAQMQYMDSENNTATITAEFRNETITDVELEQENNNRWWIFFIIAAAALALFFLTRKKQEQAVDEVVPEVFDYRGEALKMLGEAKALFSRQLYKDAYGLASEALRLYHSYEHGDGREMTATDTIRLLKMQEVPHENTQKCLNLCSMVEFAKYKPNAKDFNAIISYAKKEISSDPSTS